MSIPQSSKRACSQATLILSSEMPKNFDTYPCLIMASPSIIIHELVVRARQLDSVAHLVRVLHRNRRAAGSIPAKRPILLKGISFRSCSWLGLNLYIILNMHFILMCPDFVILLCTSNARQFYSSKGEC